MTLTCDCGGWEDWDFRYEDPQETTLKTKRPRKCASCGGKINVGDTCVRFPRFRKSRSVIEERIFGDDVQLADWHMCETCGDLFWSLRELGFCIYLGDNMRELVREYAEVYGPGPAGDAQ